VKQGADFSVIDKQRKDIKRIRVDQERVVHVKKDLTLVLDFGFYFNLEIEERRNNYKI
jgi:hypothetical protein